MPKAKTSRKAKGSIRTSAAKGSIRTSAAKGIYALKGWSSTRTALVRSVRRSERLTKDDLAIRINTRG